MVYGVALGVGVSGCRQARLSRMCMQARAYGVGFLVQGNAIRHPRLYTLRHGQQILHPINPSRKPESLNIGAGRIAG